LFLFCQGTVHYIDDKGRCSQSFITDGPIKELLYCEGKDVLVAVTDGLVLTQHTVSKDGSTTELMKVLPSTDDLLQSNYFNFEHRMYHLTQ